MDDYLCNCKNNSTGCHSSAKCAYYSFTQQEKNNSTFCFVLHQAQNSYFLCLLQCLTYGKLQSRLIYALLSKCCAGEIKCAAITSASRVLLHLAYGVDPLMQPLSVARRKHYLQTAYLFYVFQYAKMKNEQRLRDSVVAEILKMLNINEGNFNQHDELTKLWSWAKFWREFS